MDAGGFWASLAEDFLRFFDCVKYCRGVADLISYTQIFTGTPRNPGSAVAILKAF